MPFIFDNIRKLRSSKLEVMIRAIVYIIFRLSKSFEYGRIKILNYSIFQTYLSIFGVIITKIVMIRTFKNINQKISILLNSL